MSQTEVLDHLLMEVMGLKKDIRELRTAGMQLLSIEDIMAILKLGRSATYNLLGRKDAPKKVHLTAKCVRYRKSDVEQWLNSLAEK